MREAPRSPLQALALWLLDHHPRYTVADVRPSRVKGYVDCTKPCRCRKPTFDGHTFGVASGATAEHYHLRHGRNPGVPGRGAALELFPNLDISEKGGLAVDLTLTAKVLLYPTLDQAALLHQTMDAYRGGCNWVSTVVDTTHCLQPAMLHTETYRSLRAQFGLRSQMALSVIKTVIARYKSVLRHGHPWTRVTFRKPALDLVWNRDYSLRADRFSVNTLVGRIPVPFARHGMERFFDGTWQFGTAHLVHRHGRWFLYVPMTKDVAEPDLSNIHQVVGLDLGINFLVAAYDSQGQTTFFPGHAVKARRTRFKILRQELQRRQTPSARRRLQRIGQREHRWMTDVNHQVSKALVVRYGPGTLFVVEDLTGIRGATERVRRRDRYVSVSWAFYQLRQMIEYKAALVQAHTVAVDPRYTSQTCPKCGHVARKNRDKRRHCFECGRCHYRSNDDRIGAMNLHRLGMEYRVAGAIVASPQS